MQQHCCCYLFVRRVDGTLCGWMILITLIQAVGSVAVKGGQITAGKERDNYSVDPLQLIEVSVLETKSFIDRVLSFLCHTLWSNRGLSIVGV